MTLTIENQPLTICQLTQHGLLIPWGRFGRYLKLSQRLRAAVPPRHHKDALSGGDLILEFGLASLSGCEHLEDLNLGAHPLTKDQDGQPISVRTRRHRRWAGAGRTGSHYAALHPQRDPRGIVSPGVPDLVWRPDRASRQRIQHHLPTGHGVWVYGQPALQGAPSRLGHAERPVPSGTHRGLSPSGRHRFRCVSARDGGGICESR
jgi:hypothetical protein